MPRGKEGKIRCETEWHFGVVDGRTMLRNRSWPAVSHSWRRTLIPSTYSFFVTKRAPVVEVVFFGSNLFWVYRWRRLVLPTPRGKDKIILTFSHMTNARRLVSRYVILKTCVRRVVLTCVAHYDNLCIYTLVISCFAVGVELWVCVHR